MDKNKNVGRSLREIVAVAVLVAGILMLWSFAWTPASAFWHAPEEAPSATDDRTAAAGDIPRPSKVAPAAAVDAQPSPSAKRTPVETLEPSPAAADGGTSPAASPAPQPTPGVEQAAVETQKPTPAASGDKPSAAPPATQPKAADREPPPITKEQRRAARDTKIRTLKILYKRPRSIPYPRRNRFSRAKARLGKMLFFDPRLSGSNLISCGSCHNPGFDWSDGLPHGIGEDMKALPRRTPSILNAAWGEIFAWDGRFDTLEDQVLGVLQGDVGMNMTLEKLIPKLREIDAYRDLFKDAFGRGDISAKRVSRAIATYERSIVSGRAPFDRWIEGEGSAISAAAVRGFVLFNGTARCASCHSSWRFTDDGFHDTGLPGDDAGRGRMLPQVRTMQHAFKTPGLRNVDRRGPYMHDGSLPSLAAVLEHYDTGGIERDSRSPKIRRLRLTENQKLDLIAFLASLTSDDPKVTYAQFPR